MAFWLGYLHLTLTILKVKVKVIHIWTANISQATTDKANNPIGPNIMSHAGFRLVYLELTLMYSKSQYGDRNGGCLIKYFDLLVDTCEEEVYIIAWELGFENTSN